MFEELRTNSMMAHLLDALGRGEDIGHYGRLVFAMVARHFGSSDDVVTALRQDRDFSEDDARALVAQVEGAGYSPPKREKILAYQAQQDFPIVPNPDDPDAGNVYKDLTFPDRVYEHIAEYREAKAHAGSSSRYAVGRTRLVQDDLVSVGIVRHRDPADRRFERLGRRDAVCREMLAKRRHVVDLDRERLRGSRRADLREIADAEGAAVEVELDPILAFETRPSRAS